MKYPKEYLDEIKTRLKVSTVVSKSVNLKKKRQRICGALTIQDRKNTFFYSKR
jgi:DNA primase